MSSEPRLRERLDRATSRLEPDVDRHLHQALESGRRRVVVRRAGAVAGIAAAIALIVVGGPRLLRSLPDEEVPISPGPTATVPPVDLDGTWTTTVEPGQVRATLDGADLGEWADGLISGEETGLGQRTPGYPQDLTLTLADGDYELTNAAGDVLDEGSYTVEGEQLKLAQDWPNGVTIYDVALDGDVVSLTFVSDSAQPFPPDTTPHEAVTRALYTSVPFERA